MSEIERSNPVDRRGGRVGGVRVGNRGDSWGAEATSHRSGPQHGHAGDVGNLKGLSTAENLKVWGDWANFNSRGPRNER
jgi:hypothetical protein